jgi:hypothetical protein
VHKRGIRHVAVDEGVNRALYEIVEWIGARPTDAQHAFNGRQILEGPEFDFYVGDLGRRVPLSKSAQNPLLYGPATDPWAPVSSPAGPRKLLRPRHVAEKTADSGRLVEVNGRGSTRTKHLFEATFSL